MPDDRLTTPRRLPIRREGDAVVVELPARARRFLVDAADAVRRRADDPSSPGFGRLYGPLDESAETDDPLLRLERQSSVEGICGTVTESAHRRELSDAEAEAWLRMLGMAVAVVAADAGIQTEGDLERLDPDRSRLLDLLRSLQLLLARSLDPDLSDPAGEEPPPPPS